MLLLLLQLQLPLSLWSLLLLLLADVAFAAAQGGAISGLQCAKTRVLAHCCPAKHLRFLFRIGLTVFSSEKHVRFQGCAVPKLDFSHMAAWSSVGIYSHPRLLRPRFELASRAPFFFVLAVSLLLFCSV